MDKTQINGIAFVLLIILTVLLLHLTPAAMVGMLVFVLIKRLGSSFGKWLHEYKARQLAATITVLVIIAAVTVFSLYISKTLRSEENLAGLASKVGQTITDIRGELPPTLVSYMPESLLDLKGSISTLIQQHIKELSIAGKNGLHSLAHILIGIVISVLLSLHRFSAISQAKPFAFIMRGRFILLSKAFENIVFAQIKISAINTLLTSIFLLVILPMAHIHIPYANTLVIITFFTGLLPVIGNLLSNTLITIMSIGISFKVAIAALVFLVLIHKLEYFINAKIVGARIQASAWEILLAMLTMESIFGISGLILAPITYAYIKSELNEAKLI